MLNKRWLKSISTTNDWLSVSTYDYMEGRPVTEMTFAGLGNAYEVKRAFIEPYGSGSAGLLRYGGFRDASAVLPIYAYQLRVNKRGDFVVAGCRPVQSNSEAPDYIAGRWLYGGELMHHFGHFMSECSHRIYAITEYFRGLISDNLDGIIFSSNSGMNSFTKRLFCDYYGIPEDKIVIIKDAPAVIETLVFRPQGSILGSSSLSSDYNNFLEHYQKKNSIMVSKEFPKKIFFGRAHLDTGGGSITHESELENFLLDIGFVSIRPEEYDLLEQFEMLTQAEIIVAIGGSFVHLYDHLGITKTSMFLISRGDPDSFYHDRTVQSKVSFLEYYVPDSERGDVVRNSHEDGRARSMTTYNMDLLKTSVIEFVNKH